MYRVLLVILLSLCATAASADWVPVGEAVHTPNTVTILASSTPDVVSNVPGVVLPKTARAMTITVKNQPIHYTTTGTNPTATYGRVLAAGATYFISNPTWVQNFRFIDTSAGAATVEFEFYRWEN